MILLNVRTNIKKKNFNYIFNLFLFFYLIFGFYLSANTGITADEFSEQDNWRNNLEAIKGFFGSNNDGYYNLLEYQYRFYGIGFHYFSQIYLLLAGLVVLATAVNSISSSDASAGVVAPVKVIVGTV